jgi:hypothetical protein
MKKYEVVGAAVAAVAVVAIGLGVVFGMPGSDKSTTKTDSPAPAASDQPSQPAPNGPAAPVLQEAPPAQSAPSAAQQPAVAPAGQAPAASNEAAPSQEDVRKAIEEQVAPIINQLTGGASGGSESPANILQQLTNATPGAGGIGSLPIPR